MKFLNVVFWSFIVNNSNDIKQILLITKVKKCFVKSCNELGKVLFNNKNDMEQILLNNNNEILLFEIIILK